MEIQSIELDASVAIKNLNKLCGICQTEINGPSPVNLDKGKINTTISIGRCGHGYHTECMDEYLKTGNLSCPEDMVPWIVVTTINKEEIINTINKINQVNPGNFNKQINENY